ncbi:MAG: pyruvate:ferredoxin (flavodoxin) oxidoreductase [Planctomycetes bacterium]|nr:pyruvate:ferredoxin (flavodoxin) oxidoreductase [Planctomycetota bacterium]
MSILVDANEAVASVAHRVSDVIAIYPITPASSMAEWCDEWSVAGRKNIWGQIPRVEQLQSEAGAAGTVHGALQAGALATTFTASQGLLLMIPNLYKIAGELTAFTMHVAARTIATHALSIFGDHSDVMACRQTGMALLCSSSVQEAQDLALVAHAASLESRIPFLHFFDGFRTSHEVHRIEGLDDEVLRGMLDEEAITAHRARALTPEKPVIRGTAHNPDTYFQAREAVNPFYDACPAIVERALERFAKLTGRRYRLFDYHGAADPERLLVLMGSGAETARETVDWLVARGEKVGVLVVRLYRPFDARAFAAALPRSIRSIAVLDRTKEPGAPCEPLHLDVLAALVEAERAVRVVGGRYGLSSKEFTPAMVKSVFDELARPQPRNHFTVGIVDDVTHLSLEWDAELDIEAEDVTRAVFYGLGSDGTVGANKNTIKIVGEETDLCTQGYFVYDSKKSGSTTVSHLRFSPRPIRSTYLIGKARFVAVSQPGLVERIDVLELAAPGAVFLLNTPHSPEEVFASLPEDVARGIVERGLRFHVIDAHKVASDVGLPGRVSTVMQGCFFALSGVLPREQAFAAARRAIEKTFKRRGAQVVKRNIDALELAEARMSAVPAPSVLPERRRAAVVPAQAPEFVQRVSAAMIAGHGNLLPVSAFPPDGTWPSATTRYEKRGLARETPVWDSKVCIQCNKCALVCPHAAIRAKVYGADDLAGSPAGFLSTTWKSGGEANARYSIQVAPDDCTGCGLCVAICPAKDKSNPRHKAIDMAPLDERRDGERANWDFFLELPESDRSELKLDVKHVQLAQPLFEFSGACSGCGETPYLKLASQMFGDRMLIANATGCSSIYGGNQPTTPWSVNKQGRGPAWANSLFEDNAEFGLGFRFALDQSVDRARALLGACAGALPEELVRGLFEADQSGELGIAAQRARVAELRRLLAAHKTREARALETCADHLVRRSVWIIGGDGWAYDIGFGGLDHVFSSRADVNVLVLDTEVYSNTGGQQSKATPIGAVAKFAAGGRSTGKKDLGLIAMSYGHVYVASVALYARDAQVVKAFAEAESYPGPSLVIAHSPCIAHGYDLTKSGEQQKLAVDSGVWPVYRFDPRRLDAGELPLAVDSGPPKARVADYMKNEGRFQAIAMRDPERYAELVALEERYIAERQAFHEQLAGLKLKSAIAQGAAL